ncbi:RNA 2'-phosphotransferase [Rubripirellula reticaptiva]|uniref:RNA 2'-phosphotransferase n=1 Tax=Rubripirellula reticaptiva TaxID=2528013 RepID=A0A5C6EP98_9BACT|nr:RNA 2'-phosphotransferase [Rubripirellula reticaptiva]TWU49837.1 RNA 2'-phosphotransferase [Rubripirellula reticaptiva]
MNKRLTKISKYLAFILRHEPQSIGLKLDAEGYLNVDELVGKSNATGKSITREQVQQVVAGHEPPIFALSEDGSRIRAV